MLIKNILVHQAYNTHLNYIKCLSGLMDGSALIYKGNLKKSLVPDIDQKKNLIDLTKKSLNDEYKIVELDNDYSYASTSWLPIKTYYLVFNILVTIEYIFKLQKSIFRLPHISCIDEYTRKLKNKEIEFSEPILNEVFDQTILTFKVRSGANLSQKTNKLDMYKMAIRKIAKYKIDDWKSKKNIDLRKSKDKTEYQKYLKTFQISIFDFLYYMRIRSNYRDFAFIDGVSTSETTEYFKTFFKFSSCFIKALENMKQQLLLKRSSEK